MSPIAHALSASLIAVSVAQVAPHETSYLAAALISATAVDLDHVVYLIRDRALYRRIGYVGQLHQARSPLHELVGLLLVGSMCGIIFTSDPKLALVIFLAFAVHLTEDWVLGKSHPFAPFDNTRVEFFALTAKQKVFIDIIVILLSGLAWMIYLAARA